MNAVLQAMKERRSVRAYQDKPVPRDVIERICEAGTYAPTGMGFQSPIILAVTNRQLRDRLSAMNARIMGRDADPFYGAPVVLVVLADKSRGTYLYDGSQVMANLMLAAHAVGLGSCWIHRAKEEFESEEGKAILKELDDLRTGPITEEELEDCRLSLLSGMAGIEDSLGGIETWYYMEVLRGGAVQTPDEARAALRAVTREDVRAILRQLTLSVSYLLTREEGPAHV